MEEQQQRLDILEEELRQIKILIRTNNLLLARFILQLSETRKELGLPKRNVFFKFELLDDDYNELVEEFGKVETDKALYRLDRTLAQNKQQCPHNIGKYIHNRLKKNRLSRERASQHKPTE